MCGGVEARDAEKAYKVYFPSPKAAFPVMLEGGEALGWVTWGRRREEPGQGPQGGWARLETVERRVYVVTSTPPEEFAWVHDRWPLVRAIG